MSNFEKQVDYYEKKFGKSAFDDTYIWGTIRKTYLFLIDQIYALNYSHSIDHSEKIYKMIRELWFMDRNQNSILFFDEISKQVAKTKKELTQYKNLPTPYNHQLNAILRTCDFINKEHDSIHNKICKEMFDQIVNGEDLFVYIDSFESDNNESPYFAPFINASKEAGEAIDNLYCSIVTQNMIEYDNLMFGLLSDSAENGNVFYRPYYSGFVIPIDKNGQAKGRYNSDDRNYKHIIEQIERNGNKGVWFKAQFSSDMHDNDGAPYVEGYLLTAASPSKWLKGKLELKEIYPDDTEIEKDYKKLINDNKYTDKKEVEHLLKKYIGKISNTMIYNIGHGNFITFNNDNNKTKIIYDIGLPYQGSEETVNKDYNCTCKKIENINSKIVIISHWDEDHYCGAYNNEKNLFNIPWIVTGYAIKGKSNAKRIMLYLNSINKLYMIKRAIDDNSVLGDPLIADVSDKNIIFQLYRGESINKSNNVNSNGIAIRIIYNNNNNSTLMCGDIPYKCLPDSIIKKEYKYVVIPHHASNMSKQDYDKLDSITKIEYSFICVNGTEKLGSTGKNVNEGKRYKKHIFPKTTNNVFFTDNDQHDVFAYECQLDGSCPPKIIPKK